MTGKTHKTTQSRPATHKVAGHKSKPATRKVRVEVRMEPEADDVASLGSLPIMFREVLQQIPVDVAWRLSKAFATGRTVVIAMHSSKYGPGYATAFTPLDITEEQRKEWTAEVALDRGA